MHHKKQMPLGSLKRRCSTGPCCNVVRFLFGLKWSATEMQHAAKHGNTAAATDKENRTFAKTAIAQ
jgi:hypothetical protein